MGGFFGIASRRDAITDLYYGTDYHSHLGTKRGGLAVLRDDGLRRVIHNIENAQFRSKFDDDIGRMHARTGIGVISDTDDQPLLIRSHLGDFAIATVGTIKNASDLAGEAFRSRRLHFSEMGGGELNPTELVATLINQGESFEEGIRIAQESIVGSCSILLLTKDGIYAARDRRGRTPVIIGRNHESVAVTMETCALPNLGFDDLEGPGAGRDRLRHGRRLRAPRRARRRPPDLLLSLGLLRLSGLELRRDQRRSRAEPVRRRPGPAPSRGDRFRGRHPGFRRGARARLRGRVRDPVPAPLRQVHADLGPELHAPEPGGPRPRRPDEAHPDPGAHRGQEVPLLRGFHRPRDPAQGYRPEALRRRGPRGPYAPGLPAPRLRLQVPELLGVPVGHGPGRAPGHPRARGAGLRGFRQVHPLRLCRNTPPWRRASGSGST